MVEESSDGGGSVAGTPIDGGGGIDPRRSPSEYKAKSCKGCLYYSSLLKADARNPVCFGISRALKQVPSLMVGEVEMEASKEGTGANKEGRNLSDFKYTCIGYSVFLNNKDKGGDKQENQAVLPVCAGLEVFADRRTSTAGHVPAHVHKEDGTFRSQPRATKPMQSTAEEFLSRFKRNASIVTSGVVKNMDRLGNYIKQNLDDIMYPYRRRPK